MRIKNLIVISCIVLLFTNCKTEKKIELSENSSVLIDKELLLEDFLIYKQAMENLNAGIYRYTPKDSMDMIFQNAYELIDSPMSNLHFYKIIASVNDQIHDAHTSIRPSKDIRAKAIFQKKVFPFDVRFDNDNLLVEKNFSSDKSIPIGSEIISINGKNIDNITKEIFLGHATDGYIKTPKYHEMNNHFWLYYYELVDTLEVFKIELKEAKNTRKITVEGVPSDTLRQAYQKEVTHRDVHLEIDKENDVAILTIPHFLDLGLIEDFKTIFKEIKDKKINSLIVDIRNNPGGWDELNIELFKYLLKDEFKFYDHFSFIGKDKKDIKHIEFDTLDFFHELEKKELGEAALKEAFEKRTLSESIEHYIQTNPARGFHKPYRDLVFDGDLYLLFNGGSVSSGAEIPSLLKELNVAVLIGEEPNGAYEGVTAGIMGKLVLPNTKTRVVVPLIAYYNNVIYPAEKGRGAIPDYIVTQTLTDMIEEKDRAIEFTYRLIKGLN